MHWGGAGTARAMSTGARHAMKWWLFVVVIVVGLVVTAILLGFPWLVLPVLLPVFRWRSNGSRAHANRTRQEWEE
jgi:hypothetical protein